MLRAAWDPFPPSPLCSPDQGLQMEPPRVFIPHVHLANTPPPFILSFNKYVSFLTHTTCLEGDPAERESP